MFTANSSNNLYKKWFNLQGVNEFLQLHLQTNGIYEVQNRFRKRFLERAAPSSKTIYENVRKYRQHGTSLNRNTHNSGRRRSQRVPENIDNVRRSLQQNPHQSGRRNELNLPQTTFSRIVRHDVNWFPYRMKRRHEIKEGDFVRRLQFSRWIERRFLEIGDHIVIGDEAAFRMNVRVSTRNLIEYAPKGNPPDFHYDIPESRDKINVWAALCGNGEILGHFFSKTV